MNASISSVPSGPADLATTDGPVGKVGARDGCDAPPGKGTQANGPPPDYTSK
jgi:hypothetical protein